MTECARCGRCCRVIPLLTKMMSKEYLDYLRTRGLKEDQGFILIPHDCQHLVEIGVWGGICNTDKVGPYTPETRCDIHSYPDRPRTCQIFHGQKKGAHGALFYVPPGCAFSKVDPE
jgi:hypothetical protein